jgi:hypothetical protein
MSVFVRKIGRYPIAFSDHALDRWWERHHGEDACGRRAALEALDRALDGATRTTEPPAGTSLSLWHRARADHYIVCEDGFFVVNRGDGAGGRDRVATTYIYLATGNGGT